MEQEDIINRLKGIIEELGLTGSQFADACGIPRPTLSAILTRRNKKISDVLLDQIHSAFPDISIMWLLFGEGSSMIGHNENLNIGGLDNSNSITTGLNSDSDILEKLNNVSEEYKYSNVDDLNLPLNIRPDRINTDSIAEKTINELKDEIKKLRTNPRKVTHITIFYDDSTFETFYSK